MKLDEIKKIIETELTNQHFGVFNSVRNDSPHSTLVSFVPSNDLSKLIFFTPKNTRKFINSQIYNKVSLFVDTTTNSPEDIKNAITITGYGKSLIGTNLPKDEFEAYKQKYLKKNPHMEFFLQPNREMIVIDVDRYELVTNFQSVFDWILEPKLKNKLAIRQMQGDPVIGGETRGKILVIHSSEDLKFLDENYIVIAKELPEEFFKTAIIPKGILEMKGEPDSQTEQFAKKNNIPYVRYVTEPLEIFNSGDEITLDAHFGIIIQHKIK